MQANYIDHMGGDSRVCQAARISFAEEVEQFGNDEVRLIRYLAKHNHWTPFAHPQITLRMRAPVPIRTQCFKHKQGFVENEESRRYISSEPTFFIPEVFRGKPTNGAKQGSSGVITGDDGRKLYWMFDQAYEQAFYYYRAALAKGLCPEQARFLLPQGTEVNWYWTGSLAAFARFAKQRLDPHAQGEIQDLAREVSALIAPLYPVSWPYLMDKEVSDEELALAIEEAK